jgi:hypothetical protein
MAMQRLTVLAVAVAVAGVAAAAPAAAQAPPGADAERAAAVALGREAYRYGLPLLEVLRVRREQTSVTVPDARGDAPVNTFSHAAGFARPSDRTVVAPNVDTLYSIAHLDLGRGAVVLRHPAMGRRYFSFQLLDPYTNVVGYVGSRTTGRGAGRFAIVWRGRRARAPRGTRVIRVPARRIWVIGRTLVRGPGDLPVARRAMARYRLTVHDGRGRRVARRAPARLVRTPIVAPRPEGEAFLDALGRALAANPPPRRDRPLLARLARAGVGPGLRPSRAGLSPHVLEGLVEGVRAEAAALPATARADVLRAALASGGWYTPPPAIGAYGTDYELRARVALVGLGANTPEEAMYPIALADGDGALLDGARRYRLAFPRGRTPPVRAFWSLTIYDRDGYLIEGNELHAIGDTHPGLRRRGDGSIVVAIQRERPAERDVVWLRPPTGGFRLNLRLYVPRRSALSGVWRPPPVVRLP